MGRRNNRDQESSQSILSIVGPGMVVHGDCVTEGSLRVEGIIRGRVWAGKAVVVGPDGAVIGDLFTRDVVVGGRVEGRLVASSRLEVQSTALLIGEVKAGRMQLEDGATLNGDITMGEVDLPNPPDLEEEPTSHTGLDSSRTA